MVYDWGGGRGGDTFKPPPPTNNFCLYPPPVFRCFWKDPLMTPHHPTSSILHCYPLPIHYPFPPKNFDHTHGMKIMTHAGTIPSSFLLKVKVIQLAKKKQYGTSLASRPSYHFFISDHCQLLHFFPLVTIFLDLYFWTNTALGENCGLLLAKT